MAQKALKFNSYIVTNFFSHIQLRGLVSTSAAGAFAPAEICNGCNAPVLSGIICTRDWKSRETLGNLWLLKDIFHPSCKDSNEAPVVQEKKLRYFFWQWCGSGSVAEHYWDIGYHADADRCCRWVKWMKRGCFLSSPNKSAVAVHRLATSLWPVLNYFVQKLYPH